jgi:hypothetical protein
MRQNRNARSALILGIQFVAVILLTIPAQAQVKEPIDITGTQTRVVIGPEFGATVEYFGLTATATNMVGGNGLLQEGFGLANFYIPGRRINENLDLPERVTNRPAARYEYDCEGPNINGLHATRIAEPIPDTSSLRVAWRIENRGKESHWVIPWVRNDWAPGGAIDASDRLRLPTEYGIRDVMVPGMYRPARNWAAATDSTTKETIYGVFNADDAYAFTALFDSRAQHFGLRTVFTPRMMRPGDVFETGYRINLVRGLDRVDFASDVCALQIDYEADQLAVLFAPVQGATDLEIDATIIGPDGETHRLPPKAFNFSPGRMVRCTYEWTAPSEGVYEFLGKLQQSGQPFELNEKLSTPHGGIDTQFIVGDVPPARLEPWTDTPYRLQRQPRSLNRAMISEQPVPIWIESALEKIAPEDFAIPTGVTERTVRIAIARNERGSFQIVIRPESGQSLDGVSLRPGALQHASTSATIPASNIKMHRVGYVPVSVPSHFEGPTGDWPDPLIPLKTFTAEGGRCSPIWGTVYASPDTRPGVYRGPLVLTSDETDAVELTLEVTVFDFELPKRPSLKTDFGYSGDQAFTASQARGFTGTQTELDALFLDDAIAHRVTLRELAQLPAESPDYAAALRAYEPRLQRMLDQGVSTIAVPATLQEFPDQLALANQFIADHKLQTMAFTPLAHEPPRPAWPRLGEYLVAWRRVAPDIRPMVTTFGIDPLLGDPDRIWGVHLPVFDTPAHRDILEHTTNGGETWWYIDEWPPRPYANFFTDFAAVEHRTLFWQTWALGIRGLHYWNINYASPGTDPYLGLADITPVNGNGYLVYPGAEGPVSSIRWETIRDGIEDYDYLVIVRAKIAELEKRGGNAALLQRAKNTLNLGPLVQDLVGFPRDPAMLISKRREIAELIVDLNASR